MAVEAGRRKDCLPLPLWDVDLKERNIIYQSKEMKEG